MDEARLAEIERKNRCDGHSIRDGDISDPDEIYYCGPDNDEITELIAEVKRLRKLSQSNDRAYSDGESSGQADIAGIILDPKTPGDPWGILAEIKDLLGID